MMRESMFNNIFLNDNWDQLDKGEKTESELENEFANASGLSPHEVRDFLDDCRHSLSLIDCSYELLKDLKSDGVPVFALSNMPDSFYHFLVAKFDFWQLFDQQVISSKIKLIKPYPEIYDYTLRTLNIKAEETVFIDDTEKNIIQARKHGIHCIHCLDPIESCLAVRNLLK